MKKFHLFLILVLFTACKKDNNKIDSSSDVLGYSIPENLPGIWDGAVTSSTALGNFPIWIVDFRPISSNQVSAKNELDSINDIFMSFFIVKHNEEYKVAFRNGGFFAGYTRNSYMFVDSVYETSTTSFYRFSDPISGGNRVFTDVVFEGNNLTIHTFTNKLNTLEEPVSHMKWEAVLKDKTSTQDAIEKFSFPQKEITKDFSSTFDGFSEAVFYNTDSDPYPESEQPYLGKTTVNVSISNPASPDPNKKVLIIINTAPFFNGFIFQTNSLNFRSRYVLVPASASSSFTFNYMHPGNYYLNAIYDENEDQNFSSGDFMNSDFDIPFSLGEQENISTGVNINFEIP